MSDTVKGTRTPDPLTTTGNGGLTERLVDELIGRFGASSQWDEVAAVLAPVVDELVAEAKVEALREAGVNSQPVPDREGARR